MTRNFDDSLNRLKLEDGVEGVQELKAPWEDISQVFSDPPRKHLHIVVERPSTGEFEWLVAAAANLTIPSTDSPTLDCLIAASLLVIALVIFGFSSTNDIVSASQL
jgi:hypothetical protein